MECNDIDYITFTQVQKMYRSLLDSKVSKGIRNLGDNLFCWAFAISTMLRQSLNRFIHDFDNQNICEALTKLNSDDFHRQLRNEIIMIPIPKFPSNEYNEDEPLSQAHYVNMAMERVSHLTPMKEPGA